MKRRVMVEFDMPKACAWCPVFSRFCRAMPFAEWMKHSREQERGIQALYETPWTQRHRHPQCPLKKCNISSTKRNETARTGEKEVEEHGI